RPAPPRARRTRWCRTGSLRSGVPPRTPRRSCALPPYGWNVSYRWYITYARSEMSVKPRREEHTEATRAALLEAAARAFATQGFAGTSVEDIARGARLTKGALYHHFKDKTALFEAVLRGIEEGLVARVVEASARHTDPWARVDAGFTAFLEAALE